MDNSAPAAPAPTVAAPKPNGVLIIDKHAGPTSHDVVSRVRRVLKTRQVGHTGTLDPMATGVLVLAIGEGTKLVPWLTSADKEYEATIRLGVGTDTLDAKGKETAREDVSDEVRAFVRADRQECAIVTAAIASERARVMQTPPVYSAIRVNGIRAHELARTGRLDAEDDALPERAVEVHSLEIIDARVTSATGDEEAWCEIDLRIAASKGYFVRSLARDFSRALGTVGHLTMLRRVRSSAFTLADAVTLDKVSLDGSALISISDAAKRALPITTLNEAGVLAAFHGQRVTPAEHMTSTPPHARPSAWVDASSMRLVAIGECDAEGVGRVLRGFPNDV